MEMKTIYVASAYGTFRDETDFEFEHEGETEEEAINYVAYRLATEDYAYLNSISLGYYRTFDHVEYDEDEGVQKTETFKSEVHHIRSLSDMEVKDLEAYKEGQMDKEGAARKREEADKKREEANKRALYEKLKAELGE